MKTKEEIDKEFDKLTPDSFVDDNSYYDEKEWLKNNEHLYTGTMYDEPAFTLDKEKVRIFIHSKLAQQKQEMVGEVEKEIRLQSIWFDGSDTEYGMGWNGCLEQLNKQLKQNLTK